MLTYLLPLILLQSSPEPTQPSPASASPDAACASEGHAGFDLWVGEWDVFPNGSETQVATSRIERLSGGCTIRETWMPFRGEGGISISVLNHASGRWEQTWVGNDGKRVDFTGGSVDGVMVLNGYWDDIAGPGRDALIRMRYTPMEDGSVRQHGEASTDHGLSWQTSFDFIYRPKDRGTP